MRLHALIASAALALLNLTSPVSAQLDDDLVPPNRDWISPERFALEARVGPYHPDFAAFDAFYDDDDGPLLAVELDVIAWRFEDIAYLAGGGSIGTVSFDGSTLDMLGEATSEETSFSIVPLQLMAVVRVDALARKLSVPFILTGKLGYQWAAWDTDSGGVDDADGWSVGLAWAAQIALDLDFFEPSAARQMDEEWGINHSFLFFEYFGFEPTSSSLPLGGEAWCAGLGFMF
jgi:hypothetical protein